MGREKVEEKEEFLEETNSEVGKKLKKPATESQIWRQRGKQLGNKDFSWIESEGDASRNSEKVKALQHLRESTISYVEDDQSQVGGSININNKDSNQKKRNTQNITATNNTDQSLLRALQQIKDESDGEEQGQVEKDGMEKQHIQEEDIKIIDAENEFEMEGNGNNNNNNTSSIQDDQQEEQKSASIANKRDLRFPIPSNRKNQKTKQFGYLDEPMDLEIKEQGDQLDDENDPMKIEDPQNQQQKQSVYEAEKEVKLSVGPRFVKQESSDDDEDDDNDENELKEMMKLGQAAQAQATAKKSSENNNSQGFKHYHKYIPEEEEDDNQDPDQKEEENNEDYYDGHEEGDEHQGYQQFNEYQNPNQLTGIDGLMSRRRDRNRLGNEKDQASKEKREKLLMQLQHRSVNSSNGVGVPYRVNVKLYQKKRKTKESVDQCKVWHYYLDRLYNLTSDEFESRLCQGNIPNELKSFNLQEIHKGYFHNKKIPHLSVIIIEFTILHSIVKATLLDFSGSINGSFSKNLFMDDKGDNNNMTMMIKKEEELDDLPQGLEQEEVDEEDSQKSYEMDDLGVDFEEAKNGQNEDDYPRRRKNKKKNKQSSKKNKPQRDISTVYTINHIKGTQISLKLNTLLVTVIQQNEEAPFLSISESNIVQVVYPF